MRYDREHLGRTWKRRTMNSRITLCVSTPSNDAACVLNSVLKVVGRVAQYQVCGIQRLTMQDCAERGGDTTRVCGSGIWLGSQPNSIFESPS